MSEMKIASMNGIITEAKNCDLRNNVIKKIEPKRNAIIIDFVKSGESVIRIITIECLDESLYQDMLDHASTINK